jgi:hypothetical protein
MSFETDLWDSVTGYASLAALISTRLYRGKAEQKPALPYVEVFQVQNRPGQAIKGNIVVDRPVLQFSIRAASDDSTIAIKNALRNALISSGYPTIFEDEHSDCDAISKIYRRDVTARVSHG